MRRVNELIIPDNREGMFVTAVYGVLDPGEWGIYFSNAGHNPPIWIVALPRSWNSLHRTGAALGVIEGMEMDERTIKLGSGDILLLYTDGLTEAFSPADETFGVERLEQVLDPAKIGSLRGLLDLLEGTVLKFMDPLPLADDLTMLAIRRRSAD